MAGPWEKYGQAAPHPPAMGVPQTIQGPPKVVDPVEQARLGVSQQNLVREQQQTDNTIANTAL
jgi:hypothetical protein